MPIIRLLLTSLFIMLLSVPLLSAQESKQEYVVATTADDFVSRALFDAIASKFNIRFNYRSYPTFGEVLDSVKNGESDFAPNTTFTSERTKDFHFSAPTNIEYTYLFSEKGRSLESLTRVAVPVNTVFTELVRSQLPHVSTIEFLHAKTAQSLLEQGQIDGIIAPINYLTTFASSGLQAEIINDRISAKPVTIATQKGKHEELITQFIQFIHSEPVQRLLHQTVEEYQRDVRTEYLQKRIQLSGLDTSQPVTIKLETIFPYAYISSNGSHAGISVEILNQACDILLVECKILSHPNEAWSIMFDQFKQGEFDMIAPIGASESRKSFAHFAKPHHDPTSVLVKRVGYKDGIYRYTSELITERIGAIKGDFAVEKLSQALPQKEFYYYNHQQALIEALVNNEVDYVSIDRTSLNHLLRDKSYLHIEEDRSIGEIYRSSITFGFQKTKRGETLAEFFSMAMDVIDSKSIIDKHDVKPAWRDLYNAEHSHSKRVSFIFSSFAIFALMGIVYLHQQSTTDQLTGLKNRRALERRFRKGVPLGMQLLYIDINRFKQINDEMGHAFGDYVLKCVAEQINHKWHGKAYRIGGDEFILAGKFEEKEVKLFVQKLQTITVRRMGEEPLCVSLSIGIGQGGYQGCDLTDVLKGADNAMYQDKATKARASI